jgi:hypothetical protein
VPHTRLPPPGRATHTSRRERCVKELVDYPCSSSSQISLQSSKSFATFKDNCRPRPVRDPSATRPRPVRDPSSSEMAMSHGRIAPSKRSRTPRNILILIPTCTIFGIPLGLLNGISPTTLVFIQDRAMTKGPAWYTSTPCSYNTSFSRVPGYAERDRPDTSSPLGHRIPGIARRST